MRVIIALHMYIHSVAKQPRNLNDSTTHVYIAYRPLIVLNTWRCVGVVGSKSDISRAKNTISTG